MTTKIQKSTWNTYRTTGYTHDVAQDQRSAGGVHHYQVRQTAHPRWQHRIVQTNRTHASYGPVVTISDTEGEAAFATAANH